MKYTKKIMPDGEIVYCITTENPDEEKTVKDLLKTKMITPVATSDISVKSDD